MQTCIICNNDKSLEGFHKSSSTKSGHDHRCKECKSKIAHNNRVSDYFRSYISTKRSECKSRDVTFNITHKYLENLWTGICPIFNCKISYGSKGRGSHHKHSAHLDRINPNNGYVEGNVAWISGRANRIKYNSTIKELESILNYMKVRRV